MLAGCGGGAEVSVAQAPGAPAPVAASGPSPAPEVGANQDPPQLLRGEVTVFRVPGGAAFDAWIRKVARRNDVRVHLRDTRYSRMQIDATRKQVTWRKARLERAGANVQLMWFEYRDGGYLRVGIRGDLTAARRLLADLGDRVRVVKETVSTAPN